MGQKVNPHGLRVGVIKDWDSRWFANKAAFGDTLVEDYNVRNFIKNSLKDAGVPKVEIERFAGKVRIHVYCAKPGIVIGRGGENIEKLSIHVKKRASLFTSTSLRLSSLISTLLSLLRTLLLSSKTVYPTEEL